MSTDAIPAFAKLAGIALIVFALVAPVSYCQIQETAMKAAVQQSCIQSGGEVSAGWGGPHCDFSKKNATATK